MALTRYETETIISYNDDSNSASVYTNNKTLIKKLDKLCEKHPDEFSLVTQDEESKTYEISKRLVSIRPPKKKLTEEHKEKLRNGLLRSQSNLNE